MQGDGLKPARAAALRYLKTRDRTVQQMRDHLAKKEFSEEIIEATIRTFHDLGYLDDNRFAERFARNRMETRQWGRRRIADELRKRGISRDVAHAMLDEVFEELDESDLALACAEKKIRSLTGLEKPTARRRLAQFLQRKGFGPDAVFKTVNTLVPW